MAEVKKYVKEIPVTTVKTEDRVTLDLSMKEAQALNALLRRISGNPSGYRGVLTDGICEPLTAAIGMWTWEGCENAPRIGAFIPEGARPVKYEPYRYPRYK